MVAQNLACRVQPIQSRHANVDDDDVRVEMANFLYRLPTITGFAANLKLFTMGEERKNSLPDNLVVVRNQYPRRNQARIGRTHGRLQGLFSDAKTISLVAIKEMNRRAGCRCSGKR